MERLYCPDFSSVFGPRFTNPFYLSNIDSQVWPVFEDIKRPQSIKNLLDLEIEGHPVFYHRNISMDQMHLELESSGIQTALFQAIELDNDYGITNTYTLDVARKVKNSLVWCSIVPSKDGLTKIKEIYDKNKKLLAGFVLYPNYQKLDLPDWKSVLEWIEQTKLPLKIDLTDLHFKILSPVSNLNPIFEEFPSSQNIVLSCGDWGTLVTFIDKYKYNRNIYLELNLRILGGQTPTQFFKQVFKMPGFIQNWWNRVLLSSGSPTLETSQLVRGWYEATEALSLKFRHLLRIWGFRNGNRLFPTFPLQKQRKDDIMFELANEFENSSVLHYGYDIFAQSFAITQLISIQDVFDDIITNIKKRHPKLQSGSITIKSYHTTVSIILNEHEMGNFLDLHYFFAEKSKRDSQNNLHTVAALENRADFNFPDHLLASTNGHRSITYHFRNGAVSKGSREHLYALITFGPRKVKIGVDLILNKEQSIL